MNAPPVDPFDPLRSGPLGSLLPAREARVFLVLLNFDGLQAGRLPEKTGLTRENIYGALERLEKRDLIYRVESDGGWIFHVNIRGAKHFFGRHMQILLELIKAISAKYDEPD